MNYKHHLFKSVEPSLSPISPGLWDLSAPANLAISAGLWPHPLFVTVEDFDVSAIGSSTSMTGFCG
jgi:hypothetical protein